MQRFACWLLFLACGAGVLVARPGLYRRAGKRALDVVLAAALVVLAPVLAAVAAVVRLRLGSPVLFRQERPGLDGRLFTLYKFRTMTDRRDAAGKLLPDGERLTRLGALLRRTSLDELPELVNVLRGEMSLVGPRPLLVEYLEFYTPREQRRHAVRPGITGWAQVNGRNRANWNERLGMDVWYVENQTFWLDMRILFETLRYIFNHTGVVTDPRSVMLDFDEERRLSKREV